ncbi:lysine N(6)-hydroxylase/L-ornithine N(5)-oxygenase family protein [Arthrobacter sp. zg-Y895]|uniref:lysine N(6)-hydroxylase/L-ornithine N(5)-oxygenase family protein n=1 Tax=Arthrobacter sp. zg-Y895 TaxID=2886933 RepID=UPI001D159C85|nr:lysine N(6)-hydroxylase/L-ornithine N(5)-oxygenase family protein [Arthrobacter sp. zg-Y895]MCC3302683.1 lysine N(6)-hydroxylase/L-ornithine N(5)-oxygenase family protein [Arthrobacter sp. zg-Y895]
MSAGIPESGPIHDLLGIGVGPFNLGLAALTDPLPELDALFLDSSSGFDWHPGMMLESAHLQVPFMADLVTLADPCSRYSFLNFLKQTNRLYRFYIRENFYPLRAEFNAYCRWVADQLPHVRFGEHVTGIRHDSSSGLYEVTARTSAGPRRYRARRLVLGTGTQPYLPPAAAALRGSGATVLHNADYLSRRQELQQKRSITVVGSGQSAAEIYLDLLEGMDAHGYELNWVTRSGRFFPLEYTKLTLEMTSPDYVDYFHALPGATRDRLVAEQKNLYKGIDSDLINTIYDTLYAKSLNGDPRTRLLTHTELCGGTFDAASGRSTLQLHHAEQQRTSALETDAVVLATGYAYREPEFLAGITDRIRRDDAGRFDVDRWYGVGTEPGEIFVQNAELHTHGFVTPDLGMAAYRNSAIIREILGREVYSVETGIAFQDFGVPGPSTPDAGEVPA